MCLSSCRRRHLCGKMNDEYERELSSLRRSTIPNLSMILNLRTSSVDSAALTYLKRSVAAARAEHSNFLAFLSIT